MYKHFTKFKSAQPVYVIVLSLVNSNTGCLFLRQPVVLPELPTLIDIRKNVFLFLTQILALFSIFASDLHPNYGT
jgi:hypothetical protein